MTGRHLPFDTRYWAVKRIHIRSRVALPGIRARTPILFGECGVSQTFTVAHRSRGALAAEAAGASAAARASAAGMAAGELALLTVPDTRHSADEEREITIGSTYFRAVLVVVHTQREERIRIISARRATRAEKVNYMEKTGSYIQDREEDDSLDHQIDFSKGVRGKYFHAKNTTTVLCRIEHDVIIHFPTNEDLNNALRTIIAEGRAPVDRDE